MICNQKLVSQIMFRNLFHWSHKKKILIERKEQKKKKPKVYYTSSLSLSLQSFISVMCFEFSVLNLIEAY